MELNDPNRNRRVGFLGVTIATLLTPGGKLFTSAMAAGALGVAGVALLAKDDPTSSGKSSAPAIAQTSTSLNGAELLGLTDIPASESGYDPLTAAVSLPVNNQQVVLSTSQPSLSTAGMPAAINIPAPTVPLSNGVPVIVMGGVPQLPPSNPGDPSDPGELPLLPEPLYIPNPIAGPEEPDPDKKPDDEEKIIIAEYFPDDDPLKGPDVLPPSPPPRDDEKNPLVIDSGFQPLLTTAAIPIPPTIGLLLLGLVNLGWLLYRRRAA